MWHLGAYEQSAIVAFLCTADRASFIQTRRASEVTIGDPRLWRHWVIQNKRLSMPTYFIEHIQTRCAGGVLGIQEGVALSSPFTQRVMNTGQARSVYFEEGVSSDTFQRVLYKMPRLHQYEYSGYKFHRLSEKMLTQAQHPIISYCIWSNDISLLFLKHLSSVGSIERIGWIRPGNLNHIPTTILFLGIEVSGQSEWHAMVHQNTAGLHRLPQLKTVAISLDTVDIALNTWSRFTMALPPQLRHLYVWFDDCTYSNSSNTTRNVSHHLTMLELRGCTPKHLTLHFLINYDDYKLFDYHQAFPHLSPCANYFVQL